MYAVECEHAILVPRGLGIRLSLRMSMCSGYSANTQWNVSEAGDQGIPLSM